MSKCGFILTASEDGYIKFWKKQDIGIEFAKQFKAHMGPVKGPVVLLLICVNYAYRIIC